MKNFHIFEKSNEGSRVETNLFYVESLNDRRLGGYFKNKGKIIIKNIKHKDYYLTFHFLSFRFLKYDCFANMNVFNKYGALICNINLSQFNKNPRHSFFIKKENVENGKLELIITQDLHCDAAPILSGISWSEKPEKQDDFNCIPIAIQGFTGSGAGAVWDLFSEYDNIDLERNAELRFFGRYNQLKEELTNHPDALEHNDGCLKHFIGQIYFFYNKKDVHGFEISNIFENSFLISWNNFFAELINAKEFLGKKLDDATFRFPTEYSDEYKNAPFVKDGKIFYSVSRENISAINKIAAGNLTFLNQFRGKKFKALNNLCCRMDYEDAVQVIGGTKVVAVWRDPRSQYSQVIQRTNKNNIPVEFNDVETYIKYFKQEVIPWINGNNKNVLAVRLEDLLLNYKKTVREIQEFLGLKASDHTFPLMFFNPVASIQNINCWENAGCSTEIEKIRHALPEYCYNFRKINPIKFYGIRLLSHLTKGNTRKYLKMLKQFYKISSKVSSSENQFERSRILKNYSVELFGTETPSDEIVKEALYEAVKNRIYEIEMFNKRFMTFAAIIGAIFIGVYSTDDPKISVILKIGGLVMSTLWFCAICGSKYWQSYWERHVEMLEQKRGFTLYGMSANDLQKITKKRLQGFKIPMFLIHALTACASLLGFYLIMK